MTPMTKPTDDTVARMLGVTQAHEVPADATLAEFYLALGNRGTDEAQGFWKWVELAYRDAPHTTFTVYSMEVAYLAGRQSMRASPPHLNRDATVAVSPTYTYNEDMRQAPRGVKLILLGQGGVAQLSEYNGRDPFWIGWAALPRRADHG